MVYVAVNIDYVEQLSKRVPQGLAGKLFQVFTKWAIIRHALGNCSLNSATEISNLRQEKTLIIGFNIDRRRSLLEL